MSQRLIAIGDIHGCSVALDALLDAIDPAADDTLVMLGDYVDRGPHSSRVMETMVELVGQCRLVPLIGNHEIMMARGLVNEQDLEFWLQNGGTQTLASYGGRPSHVPVHHRSFLNLCMRFFETEDHFFVHASYDPYRPLPHQPDQLLFWTHIEPTAPEPHMSGKIAIVGHTPQVNGEILDLGYIKGIDTFCYGDQWLTALDVETGQVWQTNNQGRLRESSIPV